MKYFFDTEFYENGELIKPISVGIVAEDGREYYAEWSWARNMARQSPWLRENVLPGLQGYEKTRDVIATEIIHFVGERPEFWAYYCSYDWIVLCQLYGRMIDLPDGWPMYCRDLMQELARLKECGLTVPLPFQDPGTKHNALDDARWNRDLFRAFGLAHR